MLNYPLFFFLLLKTIFLLSQLTCSSMYASRVASLWLFGGGFGVLFMMSLKLVPSFYSQISKGQYFAFNGIKCLV